MLIFSLDELYSVHSPEREFEIQSQEIWNSGPMLSVIIKSNERLWTKNDLGPLLYIDSAIRAFNIPKISTHTEDYKIFAKEYLEHVPLYSPKKLICNCELCSNSICYLNGKAIRTSIEKAQSDIYSLIMPSVSTPGREEFEDQCNPKSLVQYGVEYSKQGMFEVRIHTNKSVAIINFTSNRNKWFVYLMIARDLGVYRIYQ